MTRYLLDTHVVVWSAIASNRFSAEVRGLHTDPDEEVYVSSVSVGEMAVAALPLHIETPLTVVIAHTHVEGLPLITADSAMGLYQAEVLDPSQ